MGFIDPSEVIDQPAASGGKFLDPSEVIDDPAATPWYDPSNLYEYGKSFIGGIPKAFGAVVDMLPEASGPSAYENLGSLAWSLLGQDQFVSPDAFPHSRAANELVTDTIGQPKPQGATAQIISKAIEAAPAGVGGGVPGYASALLGGAGGEMARQAYPDSKYAELVGSLAGGLVPAIPGLVRAGGNALKASYNYITPTESAGRNIMRDVVEGTPKAPGFLAETGTEAIVNDPKLLSDRTAEALNPMRAELIQRKIDAQNAISSLESARIADKNAARAELNQLDAAIATKKLAAQKGGAKADTLLESMISPEAQAAANPLEYAASVRSQSDALVNQAFEDARKLWTKSKLPPRASIELGEDLKAAVKRIGFDGTGKKQVGKISGTVGSVMTEITNEEITKLPGRRIAAMVSDLGEVARAGGTDGWMARQLIGELTDTIENSGTKWATNFTDARAAWKRAIDLADGAAGDLQKIYPSEVNETLNKLAPEAAQATEADFIIAAKRDRLINDLKAQDATKRLNYLKNNELEYRAAFENDFARLEKAAQLGQMDNINQLADPKYVAALKDRVNTQYEIPQKLTDDLQRYTKGFTGAIANPETSDVRLFARGMLDPRAGDELVTRVLKNDPTKITELKAAVVQELFSQKSAVSRSGWLRKRLPMIEKLWGKDGAGNMVRWFEGESAKTGKILIENPGWLMGGLQTSAAGITASISGNPLVTLAAVTGVAGRNIYKGARSKIAQTMMLDLASGNPELMSKLLKPASRANVAAAKAAVTDAMNTALKSARVIGINTVKDVGTDQAANDGNHNASHPATPVILSARRIPEGEASNQYATTQQGTTQGLLEALSDYIAPKAEAAMIPGVPLPSALIHQQAAMANIEAEDPISNLVQAVIQQESAGNPKAQSGAGAQGLMQLMPATGKQWAEKLGYKTYDPFDATQNQEIGTAYLKHLLETFAGDIELALASYNAGPGRITRLLEKAVAAGKPREWASISASAPAETRNYVSRIMKNYNA